MRYYVIFILTCILVRSYAEDEGIDVHVLDDDSFEHLTQASTGATTGDWLVLMTSDRECSDCKKIQRELRRVALTYQNLKNVAILDTENSQLTLRRFKVSMKPILLFFHHGYQWTYTREIEKHEEISAFVEECLQQCVGQIVTPPLDSIDVWKEDFAQEVTAALKEKRLPKGNALLVISGGLLAVMMLLYGLVCSSKPKREEVDEIRKKKEQ